MRVPRRRCEVRVVNSAADTADVTHRVMRVENLMCCEPLPFGQLRGTEPHSQTRVRSTPVHVNMSQYVARATGVAKQAAEVFSKRVVPPAVDYYNATMARNAEYVVKDPAAVDKLGRQLVFSNLAKLPGMVEGARAEVNIVKQKWAGRMDLPMAEVRTDLTRTPPPIGAQPLFLPTPEPPPEAQPPSDPARRLTSHPPFPRPRLEPRRSSRARFTPGSASGRSSAAAAPSPATRPGATARSPRAEDAWEDRFPQRVVHIFLV